MVHLTLVKCGLCAICDFRPFWKAPAELHFKMQVIHIDDVLGGDEVVQTRTNDRGVDHGCEKEGQEGQEDHEEEGRQEEEVIDLGQLNLLGYP
jgi:hypothetical protein